MMIVLAILSVIQIILLWLILKEAKKPVEVRVKKEGEPKSKDEPFKVKITPELLAQWQSTREETIKMVDEQRRSSADLVDKRERLYKQFLEAERLQRSTEASNLRAQLDILDWVMNI